MSPLASSMQNKKANINLIENSRSISVQPNSKASSKKDFKTPIKKNEDGVNWGSFLITALDSDNVGSLYSSVNSNKLKMKK